MRRRVNTTQKTVVSLKKWSEPMLKVMSVLNHCGYHSINMRLKGGDFR